MRKLMFALAITALVAILAGAVPASAGGIDDPPGVPLYVIIEVDWDGVSDYGDWTVWGPAWDPEVGGTMLTGCTNCLEMNYEFTFRGKTVQFDEVYVPTVNAMPQEHHVVLTDLDGDGVYTGSLSAARYELDPAAILYLDRIDYDIEFDENGNVVNFHYLQYEHKKME